MDAKKSEQVFDAALGGKEELPEYINIMKAAQFRAKEITRSLNMLTSMKGVKLVFQQLPKHMRRRTMGHNVKRLPQKMREIHLNQLQKSGMPIKNKRPARKWRRKPNNLLKEYTNRKRKNIWLETHIWHAKRFHMTEKWGYKLPLKSCDKTFRACYRASLKYCLIQDISYYCSLMLYGKQNLLIEGFKLMTDSSTGLTVGARAFLNSQREGSCIFYNIGKYPFGAIGEVKFIWRPSVNDDRVIWLWAHPSFFDELVDNIINVFNLTKTTREEKKEYHHYNNITHIGLNILKNQFNRFKLTGMLANKILHSALVVPSSHNKTEWFDNYLNEDENRQIFYDQWQYWESIKSVNSSAELSPHIIINLITTDPRYNFPTKRKKNSLINTNEEDVQTVFDVCPSSKFGEIWNHEVRKCASKNKTSTSQFLKSRYNLIVPEETVPDEACAIPVMLIQQPGAKDSSDLLGYASGWDIIIPSGWGLPFWLCFIMWGAKPGGLRETDSIQYEMGKYDVLPSDTLAGQKEESNICKQYTDKYFRLPPAKRINYNKIGVCSPFTFPWKKIIQKWNNTGNVEEFYILRDKKILQKLQENFKKRCNINEILNFDIKLYENCLIPVQLKLITKGCAKKYAMICMPEEKDVIKNKQRKFDEPIEEKHADLNKKLRNKLRKEHKTLLKRLRHQRVRAKSEGKVIPKSLDVIQEYAEKMRNLWLPSPEIINNSCTRKIIGFITKGENSMLSGSGRSIGFIAFGAMRILLQKFPNGDVLVRNNNTRKYRVAKLKIIC